LSGKSSAITTHERQLPSAKTAQLYNAATFKPCTYGHYQTLDKLDANNGSAERAEVRREGVSNGKEAQAIF
jgi:hypothetical protein